MSSTPAALTMRDLFADPALRSYLSNLRDWHGYIRFLGFPDRRDHPDIIVDRLFVSPLLTRRYVSPDEDPKNWGDGTEYLLTAVSNDKPMVLLGDPGMGKSALVNYLIWLLARPSENRLVARIGWHLPVPMILRDLRLDGVTDFDRLLRAFLQHPMSEPLRNGTLLHDKLSSGQCFILLDGIDEIGDVVARRRLRQAVADGVAQYPSCRWLLTSRIVGYEEVPFDAQHIDRGDHHPANGIQRDLIRERHSEPSVAGALANAIVRYVAPFDDLRIQDFARRWYEYRRHASLGGGDAAADFFVAVRADEAILRLGRVPHLLTIMALIHRIEATLPRERTLLYDRIAEAYLESIDKFRRIYSGPADLPFKKRWLARVGFEMQRRRATQGTAGRSEILADGADVLRWVRNEMQRNPGGGIDDPEQFVHFVKRRSGLLVPRGENQFAFINLSFQEYFAARALKREVTTPTWIRRGTSPLGFQRRSLADWANSATWTEALVFLFEMLSPDEDWYDDLGALIFGDGFSSLCNNENSVYHLNILLSRLADGPRSRFSISDVLDTIRRRDDRSSIHKIDLHGLPVSDLAPISDLTSLHTLSLDDTGIPDLPRLAGLTSLHALELYLTRVSDISPVAGLTALHKLTLFSTQVCDLESLSGLTSIEVLSLGCTQVSDLTPISGLASLRVLLLYHTRVSDLGPLACLTSLRVLSLDRTPVSDLRPLFGMTSLEYLDLGVTQVSASALKEFRNALPDCHVESDNRGAAPSE